MRANDPDEPLRKLKRAAERRDRASRDYRQALVAAREAGVTYTELARFLGVSRQAARQLVLRANHQAL
jgi:DNA-directed RNA polymerase specialized sigma24 family protein